VRNPDIELRRRLVHGGMEEMTLIEKRLERVLKQTETGRKWSSFRETEWVGKTAEDDSIPSSMNGIDGKVQIHPNGLLEFHPLTDRPRANIPARPA
jgi:hypothetical protein